MPTDREQYDRDGYLVLPLLTGKELAALLPAAEAVFEIAKAADPTAPNRGANLFTGDDCCAPLQALALHEVIRAAARELIGEPIVLEGVVLHTADEGNDYKQGWHRDVLQVPEELIDESRFSPDCFHNCMQINLALLPDEALWIVPASHNRPNTAEEGAAFAGAKHKSPPEADMPGAICVKLKPGEAAVYNNNMIHRGHNAPGHRRMTLHASYHCTRHPPTWHFYNKTFGELDASAASQLAAPLFAQWQISQQVRRHYPDVNASYARPKR